METFSVLTDKKIMGLNVTAIMSVKEYFSFAEDILKKNTIQRNPVKSDGKPYELLRRDLVEGCVIPPIILAISEDNDRSFQNTIQKAVISEGPSNHMQEIKDEIDQAVIDKRIIILDGLQRTLTIKAVLDELSTSGLDDQLALFLKRELRFEIYIGLSKQGILYRMLTLNTGQTPMSFRHQLEILYHEYLDGRNLPEGIEVLKEVDERHARGISKYKFSDVVEMFYAYSTGSPMPYDKKALVGALKEMSFLEDYKYDARSDAMTDLLRCYNDFIFIVDRFSENWSFNTERTPHVSRPFGGSVPAIFARTQPMAGFGAECKRLIEKGVYTNVREICEAINQSNFPEANDGTESLDLLIRILDQIAGKAKKIGDAQRLYFQICFRALLMPGTEGFGDLNQVWTEAQETYEMLYT